MSTVKRATGSFRQFNAPVQTDRIGLNMADMFTAPGTLYYSQWTQGATLIDMVQLTPTLTQDWQILSVAFVAYMTWLEGFACFGKFGKLIAGVVPSGAAPTDGGNSGGISIPYYGGLGSGRTVPLPADPSLLTTLWSPDADPMPPVNSIGNLFTPPQIGQLVQPPLAVSGEISLPVPQKVVPGVQLGVGLWLRPSLLCAASTALRQVGMIVTNASYVVTYEDEA